MKTSCILRPQQVLGAGGAAPHQLHGARGERGLDQAERGDPIGDPDGRVAMLRPDRRELPGGDRDRLVRALDVPGRKGGARSGVAILRRLDDAASALPDARSTAPASPRAGSVERLVVTIWACSPGVARTSA
jgi:hypothetical protein